ncbi:MFS transporter [Streptomyces sp. NPDC056231]|uniref:MFS transporter n=1 Tax=Streptomyces sp. NPDC056231 TaxID=3345755 RepID=UPI003AAC9548
MLTVVHTLRAALTAIPAGVLSGRVGRRKVFVVLCSPAMAAAAVLLALFHTWPSALAAAAVLGAGHGVYLVVDQALVTQVLPEAADRAKDLGVINIANSGPQVLAARPRRADHRPPGRLHRPLRGHGPGHPHRRPPRQPHPQRDLTTHGRAGPSVRASRLPAPHQPATDRDRARVHQR